MDNKIIDGKLISAQILEEVKSEVIGLEKTSGLVPGLTVILVGEDPASKVYVGSKERKAGEVGMRGQTINFSSESSSISSRKKILPVSSKKESFMSFMRLFILKQHPTI